MTPATRTTAPAPIRLRRHELPFAADLATTSAALAKLVARPARRVLTAVGSRNTGRRRYLWIVAADGGPLPVECLR